MDNTEGQPIDVAVLGSGNDSAPQPVIENEGIMGQPPVHTLPVISSNEDDQGQTPRQEISQTFDLGRPGFLDRPSHIRTENHPDFSTIMPPVDDPFNDPRGINWLPFDPSLPDDLGLPMVDAPITGLGPGAFQPAMTNETGRIEGARDSWGGQSPAAVNQSPSHYNRVSNLVMSMTAGILGLPNITYEPLRIADTADRSHPGQPAKLYSDGYGARTSMADRAILERLENQSHNILGSSPFPAGDVQPGWVNALQVKMQHVQGKGNGLSSGFVIPDSVLSEARARILPQLQGSPQAAPYVLAMDGLVLQNATLRLFIETYLKTFHDNYSFFDQSLLCIPVWGWALSLATAAIGVRYQCIPELSDFSDQLCLNLYYMLTDKFNAGSVEDSLPYIQAQTLVTISLCHSANVAMMNIGFNAASSLNNICMRLRLLDEDNRIGVFQDGQDAERAWIAWRFRESRRRTGLFIWTKLLDCNMAITTQTPPRFLGKALNLRIPCDVKLWEAETYNEWARVRLRDPGADVTAAGLMHEDRTRLMIREAVRIVRTKRTIPEPNTFFGTAVIIHSLILRVWDIGWYDVSTDMVPGQAAQDDESNGPSPSIDQIGEDDAPLLPPYLATIPEYTKWRNSACDALDVLHWDALGTSAKSGGQEGPIFLQLHMARLAILTPVREVFGYIGSFQQAEKTLSGTADSPSLPINLYDMPLTQQHCRQVLSIWAIKDRYKARLAVIHAGAIFWHVRRYSSDSFHQALAVFLAAATLWAFGKFSLAAATTTNPFLGSEAPVEVMDGDNGLSPSSDGRTGTVRCSTEGGERDQRGAGQDSRNPRGNLSSSALPQKYRRRMPSRIQIDRPIDDELAQYFIREGNTTTLMLEGVDDLCSRDGPEQVLRDGALILDSLSQIWTAAANYKQSLEVVLTACR